MRPQTMQLVQSLRLLDQNEAVQSSSATDHCATFQYFHYKLQEHPSDNHDLPCLIVQLIKQISLSSPYKNDHILTFLVELYSYAKKPFYMIHRKAN